MNTTNRLQFRYHDQVFETRDAAIDYIKSMIRFAEDGLAKDDPSYGYSLLAEPTVLLYQKEGDSGNTDPHLIIAIGSVTNEGGQYSDNKFCIIDIDKTEQEIADLAEELEKAIKSLTIIAQDSDTLKLYANKTEDGTFVSGDVKVAESYIFDDVRYKNNLMVTPEGLFIYVNLEYDEASESFTFTVSNNDGTLSETLVNLPNNYVVGGHYDKKEEELVLDMKDGSEVRIDCEELIAEWGVEGDASKTPIVLKREEIDYDGTEDHHHVEPWQDVLRADIRIKDEEFDDQGKPLPLDKTKTTNILQRTRDGQYLYVDGKASNIVYYKNGQLSNVKEALDALNNVKLSTDSDNILMEKTDGFFASSKLEYKSNENKLIFKVSSQSGEKKTEIQLNSVELFEHVYYDPVKESLILTYKDNTGETQFVEIPIGEMIHDWEWEVQNEGHNVKLVKTRIKAGNDKLSADVKLFEANNNILVDTNHSLYVRGEADNIAYGEDSNVEEAIDNLKAFDRALDNKINIEVERAQNAEAVLDEKINQEIEDRIADVNEEENRAKAEEERLDATIGDGFSTDTHETVSYKFNELSERLASEETRAVAEEARIDGKLDEEIVRSTAKDTEHDGKIEAIETEIGDGFGPRNTVRDEIDAEKAAREAADEALQEKIDAVSANTEGRLKDIINNDHSIDIDKTNPTEPIVKVNLSEEIEDGKSNIIKLNADGLYAGIDLSYEETANKLIFKTTNETKEIQLESMSSIISIEYNPNKEAIVITYMTNGHEIKTVEIPVGDLINEWRIWDGHEGAVQLEKIRIPSGTSEQDILKAEVVISEVHDDNIIVNDNGALYVPANTEVTAALSEAINSEKEERILKDRELEDKVEAETTRAKIAEAELSAFTITAINEEKTRAEVADAALQNAIDAEILNRQSGDTTLLHLIEDEKASRISGDTLNANAITAEEARAREAETRIETALNNEIARAQTKEGELNAAITNETIRANKADTELYQSIADEKAARIAGDANLQSSIDSETSRAQVAENSISERLQTEITRSTNEDQALRDLLTAETTARQEGDAELEEAIREATLTFSPSLEQFVSNGTIEFNRPELDNNVVKANVIIPTTDNIIVLDNGVKANVDLTYNEATNTLTFKKTDPTSEGGYKESKIQLSAGSIIDNLYYDNEKGEIVITYHNGSGEVQTLRFPASELFNEWDINNATTVGAIHLVKSVSTEHGDPDKLSAYVLLTDEIVDPNTGVPTGIMKPDTDNAIVKKGNSLYVSKSAMTEAQDVALCAKNELKVLEKAVIGHPIGEECGSGYKYEPNNTAIYINTATSFNNADYILDQTINKVDNKVNIVSGEVECIDSKTNKMYELLYGVGSTMSECGEGTTYQPYIGACIISAATSFNEADQMLNDQICQLLTMWVSGKTCSTESHWIEDGTNRKIQVDARLSRGRFSEMGDSDVFIEDLTGAYIDPTNNEFTDTNVLRIACIQEGPSGTTPSIDSMQNGLYLSNVWDCGLYYSPNDTEAKQKAEAAGYKTDYYTDETAEASNYNYMNNVRQNDPIY